MHRLLRDKDFLYDNTPSSRTICHGNKVKRSQTHAPNCSIILPAHLGILAPRSLECYKEHQEAIRKDRNGKM